MLSKQGYICCDIAEATLLVVVLLKQYYFSFNVADSKCSGFKGCVRYIFASLFCMSKKELFQNKEKCFLFHFESSSRS